MKLFFTSNETFHGMPEGIRCVSLPLQRSVIPGREQALLAPRGTGAARVPLGHVDTVRADLVSFPLHAVIPLKIASESERIVVVGLLRTRRGRTDGWTGLVEEQSLRRRQKNRGVDTTTRTNTC